MSLSVEQFQQFLTQENTFIIDTRDEASFLEGFIPSSIHFKPEIIHQAAALGLLSFEQPLLFIGEHGNEKIAMAYFEKLDLVGKFSFILILTAFYLGQYSTKFPKNKE